MVRRTNGKAPTLPVPSTQRARIARIVSSELRICSSRCCCICAGVLADEGNATPPPPPLSPPPPPPPPPPPLPLPQSLAPAPATAERAMLGERPGDTLPPRWSSLLGVEAGRGGGASAWPGEG